MSINQHQDYPKESKKLDHAVHCANRNLATVMSSQQTFRDNIKQAFIELDYLDSSLSYSNIMLNSTLYHNMEANFELMVRATKKPYFARIDVKDQATKAAEPIYIGKVALYDGSYERPEVIDWRAPIASVYYDGRLGEADYKVEGEKRHIHLVNKRQFTIEDAQLIDFVDVDISNSDAFLQATLGHHAGEKLKDIVSTIQGEQNDIIRADLEKPLIVQGVAGSGKTTIALHRIAYLIYTYAQTFHPEDFMIIAPNHVFLDYISSVLPELGAEKVKQTTYVDLCFQLMGKTYKLVDTGEKLNQLIHTGEDALALEDQDNLIAVATFKHSLGMKTLLDAYAMHIERTLLPKEDFMVGELVVVSKAEIEHLYLNDYSHMPFVKRLDQLKQHFTRVSKKAVADALEAIENHYDNRIQRIRDQEPLGPERSAKIIPLMDARDEKLAALKKAAKTAVKQYMQPIEKKDLFTYYFDLITNPKLCASLYEDPINHAYFTAMAQGAVSYGYKKLVELEDLTAMAYLSERVFGLKEDWDAKCVVIDEAQDFGPFQFYYLRKLLKTDRFTILGDLAQGIHMYRSITDWDYLKTDVFQLPVNYLTLEQSYRTTIEIMNLANCVIEASDLDHLIMAKPVIRHGEKPKAYALESKKAIMYQIHTTILDWKAAGTTTVAVITKTAAEAKAVYDYLKRLHDLDMMLIQEKSEHFNHPIVIVPSNLAKGLEFDSVIITTLSERFTTKPLDAKLLYVAMTRALHHLSVIYAPDTLPEAVVNHLMQ